MIEWRGEKRMSGKMSGKLESGEVSEWSDF